jgi:hypothetical protein
MTNGTEGELANVNTRASIAPSLQWRVQVLFQSRAGSKES